MARAETSIYNETYAARYLSSIRTPYSQLKYTRIAQLAAAGGKPNPVVLDIGGNINGTVQGGLRSKLEAADPHIKYVPLDVSDSYFNPDFLRSIQPSVQVFPEVNGIVGDAHAMNIPTGSVDMVVLADVLEHLDQPVTALREVSRVLREDGKLFLVIPSLYKLDVFKGSDPSIYAMVNEKRPTSHVNFYDTSTVQNQFAEAELTTVTVEGLGYLTGFPYMLWTNPKYIPNERENSDTRESAVFKRIKSTLSALDVTTHLELDQILNGTNRGRAFIQQMITDPARHPLDMMYDALKLHPAFQRGEPAMMQTYDTLRQLVESEKPNFDAQALRDRLSGLVGSNSYQYLANSVIFIAEKTKDPTSKPNVAN